MIKGFSLKKIVAVTLLATMILTMAAPANLTVFANYSSGYGVTVTYYPNGGDGRPYTVKSESVIANPGFTKSGYVFKGWCTNPYGTGVWFAPGTSTRCWTTGALYAMWGLANCYDSTPVRMGTINVRYRLNSVNGPWLGEEWLPDAQIGSKITGVDLYLYSPDYGYSARGVIVGSTTVTDEVNVIHVIYYPLG